MPARNRKRMVVTLLTMAVLGCVAGMCQCVYFNMFYNAKSAFNTAYESQMALLKNNPDSIITPLPSDIQTNYDKAIDKAIKVIDEFPKAKKWHDDALILIAKASYYKGDYEKTIRVCNQLLADFPNSPFIPEGYLFLGRANLEFGNFERADAAFTTILEKYPSLNNDQQITLLVAETAARREGKNTALSLMEQSSKNIKIPEKRFEILLKTVRLAIELNQYRKALALMDNCPRRYKKFFKQLYRIDLYRVICFQEIDSLDAAYSLVQKMLKQKEYQLHLPELQLKKGELLMAIGKTAESVEIYEMIIAKDSTKDAAGVAYYQLGCWQQSKNKFDKAKRYFSKASSIVLDSVIKNDATLKVQAIDSLNLMYGLKDSLGTDTAVKVVQQLRNADEKIGELYWLELNKPDSAYYYYKKLSHVADSLQPKILYAASYLAWNAVKDTAGGDSILALLVHLYPANKYTQQAQMERGIEVTAHTQADSAHAAYLSAETLYYDKHLPEAAAREFQAVYVKFPKSEFGMKGLYTAAWINDNELSNNKTALKLYHMVCDSFPNSELCENQVKPLLKVVADSVAARKARKAAALAAQSKTATSVVADSDKKKSDVQADSLQKPVGIDTTQRRDSTRIVTDTSKGILLKDSVSEHSRDSSVNRTSPATPVDTSASHAAPPVIPDPMVRLDSLPDTLIKNPPVQTPAASPPVPSAPDSSKIDTAAQPLLQPEQKTKDIPPQK